VKIAPGVVFLHEENMVRHDMEGSRKAGSVEGCIPFFGAYAGSASCAENAADYTIVRALLQSLPGPFLTNAQPCCSC
jgi:hypothetical protein